MFPILKAFARCRRSRRWYKSLCLSDSQENSLSCSNRRCMVGAACCWMGYVYPTDGTDDHQGAAGGSFDSGSALPTVSLIPVVGVRISGCLHTTQMPASPRVGSFLSLTGSCWNWCFLEQQRCRVETSTTCYIICP